jgi:hypothetical protein
MVDHIIPGCRKTIPAATVDILSFAKWLEQFLAIPKPENNPAIQYWIMIHVLQYKVGFHHVYDFQ